MLVLTYAENIKKNDKFAFKGDTSRGSVEHSD
jgi:hypothetical protein